MAKGNPAWKKGVSANPAGRPEGSGNKMANLLRDKHALDMEAAMDRAFAMLHRIRDPAEYIAAFCQLAPYFIPRLKATEISVAPESDGLITIQYLEPPKP